MRIGEVVRSGSHCGRLLRYGRVLATIRTDQGDVRVHRESLVKSCCRTKPAPLSDEKYSDYVRRLAWGNGFTCEQVARILRYS